MYQIGDRVLYSSHGVCQIVSTQERVIDRNRAETGRGIYFECHGK